MENAENKNKGEQLKKLSEITVKLSTCKEAYNALLAIKGSLLVKKSSDVEFQMKILEVSISELAEEVINIYHHI